MDGGVQIGRVGRSAAREGAARQAESLRRWLLRQVGGAVVHRRRARVHQPTGIEVQRAVSRVLEPAEGGGGTAGGERAEVSAEAKCCVRCLPSVLGRRVVVADEGSRAVGLRRLGAARYRARVHRCRRPRRRRAGGSVRAQAAADDLRGLSLDQSASLLFVDQLGSVAGYVGFGYASDFFGRRPSFTAFSIVKAVGLIMVTLGWGLTSGYSPTLFAFMFLVGVGEGNWGCIGPLLNEVFR